MSDGGDLPAPNVTRANIVGKVPDAAKPAGRSPARSSRGGKMPGHRKRHVKHLKKAALISPRAAKAAGL